MKADPKAVVLLSGGLDSSTTLAIAQAQGFDAHALSFRYGQRHTVELEGAQRVAAAFDVSEHRIIDIDLAAFGGSALTADIPVPKGRSEAEIANGVPITYVPARNTVFLSYALAWAEVLGASDIFIGVNAIDYSGYPDCRPEYIEAYQEMARLATKAGVEGGTALTIHAPLMHLTKKEIINTGLELGVDYGMTVTCYEPTTKGEACGECDACQLRLTAFRENGLQDPAPYVKAIA
jgi:7-cyano-7-deazaguanine synthase